jgi:predicted ABC-class ATPase
MRELYERFDVSTVIVAGSCGAYFQVADQIVHMDRYVPKEITVYAKEQAQAFPLLSGPKPVETLPIFERIPAANRQVRAVERLKLKTGREGIQLQKEWIDLRYVEQLVDAEQVAALGYCMAYLEKHVFDQKKTVQEVVCEMINILEKKGLEAICEQGSKVAALAMPRQQELFACINRYRGLQL